MEWMLYLFEKAGKKNSNNTNFQFWQQDNDFTALFTHEMLRDRLDYLHANPVRAGIVWESHHYRYSSAVDYCTDQKGKMDIEHLQIW